MAAAVLTYNLDNADRIQLGGNQWLVTGEITADTGDYAAGGVAVTAANFNATTIDRLILGGTSILGTHVYWVKSTLKIKVFKEDAISGVEAEHAASALTAQTWPFIAVVRKAE